VTGSDGSLPGGPRNGLPAAKPYVYRGLGYDIYASPRQRTAEVRVRRRSTPAAGNKGAGAVAVAQLAQGRRELFARLRDEGASFEEAAEAAGVQRTTALKYEACRQPQDAAPEAAPQIAPEPHQPSPRRVPETPAPELPAPPPGPERCGTCGYLLTAPGHKLACGSGAG
jgi:hypothetical protein